MIIRDNFSCFCIKTHIVTPHLNLLKKTAQMRGHNMWFQSERRKIIIKYSLLSLRFLPTLLVIQVLLLEKKNFKIFENIM